MSDELVPPPDPNAPPLVEPDTVEPGAPGGAVPTTNSDGEPLRVESVAGLLIVTIDRPVPPPPPPVPAVVTMRQARLALLQLGLLDDVDAAINALPSPQKEAARVEWEYSGEVHRDRPFVQQLAPVLGLDGDDLDQLFTTAAAL